MKNLKEEIEDATKVILPDCFICGDSGEMPYFRYNPNLDVYETGTEPCEFCKQKEKDECQQESDEINADIKGK